MNNHSIPHRQVRRDGFSLVEITIALGVLAFALTAIMGLIAVSLQSSREGIDDTLIAEMSTNLLNTVRKQNLTEEPKAMHVFFDRSGKRLNKLQDGVIQPMAVGTAVADDAIYDCALMVNPDPDTIGADGTTNLWRITLDFRWPAGAADSPNQQTIHADLAKY